MDGILTIQICRCWIWRDIYDILNEFHYLIIKHFSQISPTPMIVLKSLSNQTANTSIIVPLTPLNRIPLCICSPLFMSALYHCPNPPTQPKSTNAGRGASFCHSSKPPHNNLYPKPIHNPLRYLMCISKWCCAQIPLPSVMMCTYRRHADLFRTLGFN